MSAHRKTVTHNTNDPAKCICREDDLETHPDLQDYGDPHIWIHEGRIRKGDPYLIILTCKGCHASVAEYSGERTPDELREWIQTWIDKHGEACRKKYLMQR